MKKPKIAPNAKQIALRSYSLWLNRLAFAMMILPDVIFYVFGIDTNPRVWFLVGVLLYIGVEVARYVRQDTLHSHALVTALAAFLAMGALPSWMQPPDPRPAEASEPAPSYTSTEFKKVAIPLIAKWEGLRTEAYLDVVNVPTVCFGETKGVKLGDSYTKAECVAMLEREVMQYRAGWHNYLTPQTLTRRLTPSRDAAYTSLAYNVGVAGAGKSTATRRLNAGDIAGGCEAITWWNKAGGRVIRGLVRRRTEDFNFCMKGLN